MSVREELRLRGVLRGHKGWVTAIAAPSEGDEFILSASRDKTVIVWDLSQAGSDPSEYGRPKRSLIGHAHYVEDVVLSSDGLFALSASWDKTLRLWDLSTGTTARHFLGHTGDVLTVAFSPDNRQIVSGSRDKTIKLWNTLGECKFTMEGHTDWVANVRFSPEDPPLIVSAGWDNMVKTWNLNQCQLKDNLVGHTGYVNTVTVSPDGTLCASGGKDGTVKLWRLNNSANLYTFDAGATINALVFSPSRYWLCAGTDRGIIVWDLETKKVLNDITHNYPDFQAKTKSPGCLSLAWSADGTTLFSGYTDNIIRVWKVESKK